jgi:hypothetical protein
VTACLACVNIDDPAIKDLTGIFTRRAAKRCTQKTSQERSGQTTYRNTCRATQNTDACADFTTRKRCGRSRYRPSSRAYGAADTLSILPGRYPA